MKNGKRTKVKWRSKARYQTRPVVYLNAFQYFQIIQWMRLQAFYQQQKVAAEAAEAGKAKQVLPNHHAVLGVPRTASNDDIKAAFRRLAKEYHPDVVAHLGSEIRQEAERKMTMINEAYEQLSKNLEG